MKRCVPLEPAAEAVCNQSSVPPLIFQLPPEKGRRVLEEAQDTPVYKYPAQISSDCINIGMWKFSYTRKVSQRTFSKDKFAGRIP